MSDRRLAGRGGGALDVAAAAALWGTAGTVQELLLPTAAPITVASLRCLAAGAILLVLAAPRPAARAALVETVRHGGWPLVAATVAMATFQASYLLGIRTAGVAVGTLVALGSAPLWAGVFALLARRRPTRRWGVATLLAIGGLVALVGTDPGDAPLVGVLLAAVAGVAYAGYATASAQLTVTDRASVVVVVFTACGLVLAPSVAITGMPVDGDALVGLAWLAVATTVVPYQLFLRGLLVVDAPTATTLSLLEPLTATLLAVTLVGERLTSMGVAGVVALAVGVLVAGRAGHPRPRGT